MGSAPSHTLTTHSKEENADNRQVENKKTASQLWNRIKTEVLDNGIASDTSNDISNYDSDDYFDSDAETDDLIESTVDYNDFKAKQFESLTRSAKCLTDDSNSTSTQTLTVLTDMQIGELISIYKMYFKAEEQGFDRQLYEKYQKVFGEQLIKLELLAFFVKLMAEILKNANWITEDSKNYTIMVCVMGLLHNCTDLSDEFAAAVANTQILEMIKKTLDENRDTSVVEDEMQQIILNCHGIAHNVSMREKNVARLRSLDFTHTIAPYLESQTPMIRISALATLANIVIEKECDIIDNYTSVVSQLLMLLNNGMETESRRSNGWSCKECALAIRQLARNDANKKILHELNAMQSLATLAKSEDKEEQLESLQAILALSFNDNIRAKMTSSTDLGVVDLLLELNESSEDEKIKKVCEKTLWNLKDDLLSSMIPKFKAAGERMQTKNVPEIKTGHIMISYQRENRKFLFNIRDKLEDNGYEVWMDVGKMGGCVYETMANAVENANVFLMCYTRKYKESENCQYEAKYAHKKKKPVIPLKMERDYDPDGWLGLLLKSDYFLEFTDKYDHDEKFKELLLQIKEMWPSGQKAAVTPMIVKRQEPVLAKAIDEVDAPANMKQKPKERKEIPNFGKINIVRGWDQQTINHWLERNHLKNLGIDKITALEIALMARMLVEVPEQLYECLRQDLKIKNLSTKAKIVWALDDLMCMTDE